VKQILKKIYFNILRYSLYAACNEQKILSLRNMLAEIVPDLSQQYSTYKINDGYLVDKVRSQHAFQISLALSANSKLRRNDCDTVTIVDIGDSSGTHLQYLKVILGKISLRPVAVNLDSKAIEKIRESLNKFSRTPVNMR